MGRCAGWLLQGKVKALVTQLGLTLCNSMDCSPPGSSVHEILQARILEWVVIPFSRESPDPGVERGSPSLQADSLPSEQPGKSPKRQKSNVSFLISLTSYREKSVIGTQQQSTQNPKNLRKNVVCSRRD